jgi:hypothetical protein
MRAQIALRDKELSEFAARYCEAMKDYKPSAEEIFANFPPGTQLVNVLTGQKIYKTRT